MKSIFGQEELGAHNANKLSEELDGIVSSPKQESSRPTSSNKNPIQKFFLSQIGPLQGKYPYGYDQGKYSYVSMIRSNCYTPLDVEESTERKLTPSGQPAARTTAVEKNN